MSQTMKSKVLQALETHGALYLRQLRRECKGSNEKITDALRGLEQEGRVARKPVGSWYAVRSSAVREMVTNGQANVFPKPWWKTHGGWWG